MKSKDTMLSEYNGYTVSSDGKVAYNGYIFSSQGQLFKSIFNDNMNVFTNYLSVTTNEANNIDKNSFDMRRDN
jgi:hypothetical protein